MTGRPCLELLCGGPDCEKGQSRLEAAIVVVDISALGFARHSCGHLPAEAYGSPSPL